jgi:hypothetical protein
MSKFLLNLHVQISKVCQKSKFQIKFERILILNFGPAPVFGPAVATSFPPQPARSTPPHWASVSRPAQPAPPLHSLPHEPRPAFYFLRMKPTECRHPLPLSKWPEHSPLITSHYPTDPLLKQLIMELHYAAASPSMVGCLRSSPRPYKRCPSTPPHSHHPSVLPLSFPPLLSSTAITVIVEPDATSETPLHRLPTHDDHVVELAGPSFPSPAPCPELLGTGVARGRATVSSHARQWLLVHGGPVAPWTESMNFSVQK